MTNDKPKILIVDDDEVIRAMYADVFQKEGFIVQEATDGLEGLDKAIENIPDVVFTGIVMPRMDGFSFIEALLKNIPTANVPIVISFHLGRKEDKERTDNLGVKDFIIRDMVTPKEAVERVRKVLGSGDYKLRMKEAELDAAQLARDIHINNDYKCRCSPPRLRGHHGGGDRRLPCFDATRPAFFGPTGVDEAWRGRGIGRVLLWQCLEALAAAGYAYAIIGGVHGRESFYEEAAGAIVIPGSDPGIYRNNANDLAARPRA